MRNPFGIQSENKFDTYDKLIEYNMANNRIIHFIVNEDYFDFYKRMAEVRYGESLTDVELFMETADSLNGMGYCPDWLNRMLSKTSDEYILFFKNYADASDEVQRWVVNFLNTKNCFCYYKIPRDMKIILLDMSKGIKDDYISKYVPNLKVISDYNPNKGDFLRFLNSINIHPLVYSFLLSEIEFGMNYYFSKIREIEEISNMLYKNNILDESMLVSSKKIIKNIINFANQEVISLQSILNHEYNINPADLSFSQQCLMVGYLSTVGDENIETVRNFIIQMNPKLVEYFDILWIRSDEDRRAIIEELSKTNNDVIQRKLNNN